MHNARQSKSSKLFPFCDLLLFRMSPSSAGMMNRPCSNLRRGSFQKRWAQSLLLHTADIQQDLVKIGTRIFNHVGLAKASQDHLVLLCSVLQMSLQDGEKHYLFLQELKVKSLYTSIKTTGVPNYFYLSLGRTTNRLSNWWENQGLIQLSSQFPFHCCYNTHVIRCAMRHSSLISCWIAYTWLP